MSKNYTKYSVEGLGESLNKRNLVFTIVKDWIEKNNPSFEDLQKAFPDEIQGSKGFIRKEKEVVDMKRFNMREPLKIKNGAHVVVSNQWGENIEHFIAVAEKMEYVITFNKNQMEDEITAANIEFDNNFPKSFIKVLKQNRTDKLYLESIDSFLERSLAISHKNYGAAKIFESLSCRGHEESDEDFTEGFRYDKEDYDVAFALSEDVWELKEKLQEQNLIDIIIEYEEIGNIESLDFKLFYPAYLKLVINKLAELEDADMLAEFIASQSLSFSSFVENSHYQYGSDWILDMCDELIQVFYGIDSSSQDYENEIVLNGNYFGISMDIGVDYIKISEDIIAQLN